MYSRNEWYAFMSMLPEEDRMSYEDYLLSLSNDNSTPPTTPPTTPPPIVSTRSSYCPPDRPYYNYYTMECVATQEEVRPRGTTPPVASPPVVPPTAPPVVPPTTPPIRPITPPPITPPFRPVTPPPPTITPPPPPPQSPPPPPPTNTAPPKPPMVKSATPDIVQFNDDTLPAEVIADLLFENVGGQELLMIARYDTVNGQSVLYQPIVNLDLLQQEYNPNNLIKLQDTSNIIFGNFPIPLETKIPNVGTGANATNMYIDSTGSLVIEFVNLRSDEIVEVQISSNGTIYEVGI